MLELRLAGIHDDGEHLILESSDGSQYVLPIDQNLRTSIAKARRVQPTRGRTGTGAFGPRDIQVRFRQGASIEEIVAESGWDADRVRRYEWPIVAERANVINSARRSVVSQPAGQRSATKMTLDQHIQQVAEAHGFDTALSDWSTYQQESGQWTVSLDYDLSETAKSALPTSVRFPARWSFNPANQSIYASNEAAYFLLGRLQETASVAEDTSASLAEEAPASIREAVSVVEHEPKAPLLTAIPTPRLSPQEEVLEELDSRRGARDFTSARERKLADLLERARRSSIDGAKPTPAPASPAPLSPVAAETEPKTKQVAQTEVAPAEVTPAQQVEVPLEQAPARTLPSFEATPVVAESAREVATELESSLDSVSSAESEAVAAEENVTLPELVDAPAPTKPAVELEADLADVAVAPSRGRRFAAPPAEDAAEESPTEETSAEPNTLTHLSEETDQADAADTKETAAAEAEEKDSKSQDLPRSSNRSKRTSVPSWDDIIFGNQRR